VGPVFVSGRPFSILSIPIYILGGVLTLALLALTGVLWLLVGVVKAVTWLIAGGFKTVWWLLAFPFRLLLVWPIRAWRRHRAHRHVTDAFAQPPTGPRIAA
jgi:hypothetical protein